MEASQKLLEALAAAENADTRISAYLVRNREYLLKVWHPDPDRKRPASARMWAKRAQVLSEQFPGLTANALRMAWYRVRATAPKTEAAPPPVARGGFGLMSPRG